MAERLGLRAAAAKLGISHVGLKKAADGGRVTRGEDGLFDVEQCRAELAKNSHPGKQKSGRAQQKQNVAAPASKPTEEENDSVEFIPGDLGEYDETAPLAPMDYNRLLCERERIKIEDARLNLRVKRGELVPLAEINAYISDEKIRAREILTRLGPELRDRLAQTVDAIECERLVMAQVTRALTEMSEYKLPE